MRAPSRLALLLTLTLSALPACERPPQLTPEDVCALVRATPAECEESGCMQAVCGARCGDPDGRYVDTTLPRLAGLRERCEASGQRPWIEWKQSEYCPLGVEAECPPVSNW